MLALLATSDISSWLGMIGGGQQGILSYQVNQLSTWSYFFSPLLAALKSLKELLSVKPNTEFHLKSV